MKFIMKFPLLMYQGDTKKEKGNLRIYMSSWVFLMNDDMLIYLFSRKQQYDRDQLEWT
jgi:hypothetical protein